MNKILLATALLTLAGVANAHDVDVAAVSGIQLTDVATVYSLPGEGRTDFVKRAGVTFTDYTEKTGHEACGVVAVLKDGADGVRPTFSIKIVTVGSQIACGTDNRVADGYMSMGDTAHSHPVKRQLKLTALDAKLRGNAQVRRESTSPCKFSTQDYAQKGFLFACGKTLYQNGPKTDKEL